MGNNNPYVSIVIPTYNVEKYIEKTLHSIIAQTFRNYEIIVVDDASTDNTFQLCLNFKAAHSDACIEVYKLPHGGVSSARNFGIEKSRGEYLHFMDSDDELQNSMYETFHSLSIQCDYDILIGAVNVIKPNEAFLQYVESDIKCPTKAHIVHWLRELSIADKEWMLNVVWNKWFKRDIIMSNSLRYINICPGEDYEFVMRYLKFCRSAYISSKPIYKYYQRGTESLLNRKYSHGSQIERRVINWNTTQDTLASVGVFNPSFLLAEGYSLYSAICSDMRNGGNRRIMLKDYYNLKQYDCISLYFKSRNTFLTNVISVVFSSKNTLFICLYFALKRFIDKLK